MTPIVLFILYLASFVYCIYRFQFFKAWALDKFSISAIFLIKVVVAGLYGYIHQFYFDGGDTLLYFEESNRIAQTFFQYPSYYIQSILGMSPPVPDAEVYIYPSTHFIKKDLGTYVIVHLHALPLMFSAGSYAVHTIFVAFLSLIASLNMYKVFSKIVPQFPKLLILATFFLPSALFWTSGFHKDLWVYLGLSWVLTGLLALYEQKRMQKAIGFLFLGLITVGLFRNYLLLLIFPAMTAYLWTIYSRYAFPVLRFSATYLGLAVFLVMFTNVLGIDILGILSARQHEFLAEKGGSSIMHLVPWEPNFLGFISFFPNAMTNAAFRPFFWNCQDFLQYLAAFEIAVFWAAGLFCIRFSGIKQWHPISYLLLTYALSNLLLIGYLVGNLGTIARYRAIALGFLAIVFLQLFKAVKQNVRSSTPKFVKPEAKLPSEHL